MAIAQRFLNLLEGNFPAGWWVKPSEVSYLYGFGYNREKAPTMVKDYLDRFGEGALFLEDKPELKAAHIAFAKTAQR